MAHEGHSARTCCGARWQLQPGACERPGNDSLSRKDIQLAALRGRCVQVDAIRNGTALILQCHRQKRYDDVVMNASAKLLKVVPEVRDTFTSTSDCTTGPSKHQTL